jgi:cytochrome c553
MKAISLVRLLALGALVGLVAISEPAQAQGPARGWGWSQGPAIEGDLENGKRLASAACAACHGPDGNNNDPQYPKLAGQSVAYLYRQLIDYQAGVRRSEVMAPMTNPLSLADMADLASFYSRQLVRSDAVNGQGIGRRGLGYLRGLSSGAGAAVRRLPRISGRGSSGRV